MNDNTLYVSVSYIKNNILPIGKKQIRRIATKELSQSTIRNGNRILVNREELLEYLERKQDDSTEVVEGAVKKQP